MIVLVDSGPLVASLVGRDAHHGWATRQLSELREPLRTCEAVLSEAFFLLQRCEGGTEKLCEILRRGLVRVDFDLERQKEFVMDFLIRYRSTPMSLADACLVRMAELQPKARVFTVNRHFKIYRRLRRQVIPLIFPP